MKATEAYSYSIRNGLFAMGDGSIKTVSSVDRTRIRKLLLTIDLISIDDRRRHD